MCQFGIYKCHVCTCNIDETIIVCDYARKKGWQRDSQFQTCPNVQKWFPPDTQYCDSCSKKIKQAKDIKKSEKETRKNPEALQLAEVMEIENGYRARQELRIAVAVQAAKAGSQGGGKGVESGGEIRRGSESLKKKGSMTFDDLTWGEVMDGIPEDQSADRGEQESTPRKGESGEDPPHWCIRCIIM